MPTDISPHESKIEESVRSSVPSVVSIIIPSLQEEKLIEQVLLQFTPDIKARYHLEIVLSDGGSTDRTIELARPLADVVVSAPAGTRQTISVGRNLGAKAARGDVFIFINADTLIEDVGKFLPEVLKAVSTPGTVAATCTVGIYPVEERLQDRLFHGFYNMYFRALNIVGVGMGRGECHVVRRKHFEQLGGYSEEIAAGEDFDFFRRLSRLGHIAFLPHLRVNESPRRYRKYGYLLISLMWAVNSLAVVVFRRSFHKHWKPVR